MKWIFAVVLLTASAVVNAQVLDAQVLSDAEAVKAANAEPPSCGTMSANACAVFIAINFERTRRGLKALQPAQNCGRLAHSHSVDMAVNKFFSHVSPKNGSFGRRVQRFGVAGTAGENIAYGDSNYMMTVKGWMNSKGHRANILNRDYRFAGMGYAVSKTGRVYYSQCFSSK